MLRRGFWLCDWFRLGRRGCGGFDWPRSIWVQLSPLASVWVLVRLLGALAKRLALLSVIFGFIRASFPVGGVDADARRDQPPHEEGEGTGWVFSENSPQAVRAMPPNLHRTLKNIRFSNALAFAGRFPPMDEVSPARAEARREPDHLRETLLHSGAAPREWPTQSGRLMTAGYPLRDGSIFGDPRSFGVQMGARDVHGPAFPNGRFEGPERRRVHNLS